ncbi:hypothetical protein AAFN86_01110 [Roseomonas sp. CAU 1739]|uniref:hypothetical protein n=1 Tax=Roseomonas sp. CAU 1739 TaxID=3140364 RepID=UPI00325B437B
MTAALGRARLLLVCGAVLVFLGGLLLAIGRWNGAEIDRAFVEATALAGRASPAPGGVRYWAPGNGALPEPGLRARFEASERLRQRPSLTAPASVPVPGLPSSPFQWPRTGALPADKPPAAAP